MAFTIGAGQLIKVDSTANLEGGSTILGYDATTGAGEPGYDTTLGALKIRTGPSTYVNIGASVPAGSNTEIQFNTSGSFDASSNFIYNKNEGLIKNIDPSNVNTYISIQCIESGASIILENSPTNFLLIEQSSASSAIRLTSSNDLNITNNGTGTVRVNGVALVGVGSATKFLNEAGNYVTISGASAAGSNTEVQYNDSGSFGATSRFTIVESAGDLNLNLQQTAGSLIFLKSNTTSSSLFSESPDTNHSINLESSNSAIVITANSANNLDITNSGAGTVTVNGVSLTNAGSATNYLNEAGNYTTPSGTAAAGSTNQIQFNTSGAFDANTNFVFLDSTERFGVGLTTPTERIHSRVDGIGDAIGVLVDNNYTTGTVLVSYAFASAGTTKAQIKAAVYGDGYMAFYNNDNTEKMRLSAHPKLGVNTASPDGIIHANEDVDAGDTVSFMAENSGSSGICTSSLVFAGGGGGGNEKARIKCAVFGDGYMAFHNNNDTEKMRLDASGNLAIGHTSPFEKLDVVGKGRFGDSTTNYVNISTSGIELYGSATTIEAFGSNNLELKATSDSIIMNASDIDINATVDISGETLIGSATNNTKIQNDGVVLYNGDGGLQAASISADNITTQQTATLQNTWYKITSYTDDDFSNGNTAAAYASGRITVFEPGWYFITALINWSEDTPGDDWEFKLEKSGTTELQRLGNYTVEGKTLFAGAFNLIANDYVETFFENLDSAGKKIEFSDLKLSLFQIAG